MAFCQNQNGSGTHFALLHREKRAWYIANGNVPGSFSELNMYTTIDVLVKTARDPEISLPPSPPLTLTRNFTWVMGFCLAALVAAPLLIAWTASIFLY